MGASFPGPCAPPGRQAGGDFVRQLCRWALLGSGRGPSWGPSQRLPRALSPHPSSGLGTRARAWMTRTAQVARLVCPLGMLLPQVVVQGRRRAV